MPRKTLKERKEKNPTDDKTNRLRELVDSLTGLEKPDNLMEEIKNILPSIKKIQVEPGNIYTFTYIAKTPGLSYDMYPLVGVTKVFNWGFIGINFHWGESRQYTWDEIVGDLYEIQKEELTDLQRVPYADLSENPSK
jgi:hypothetical protein